MFDLTPLLERGVPPDWLIRMEIRNQVRGRLKTGNKGSMEAQCGHLMKFVEELKQSPIEVGPVNLDDSSQPPEVPISFYQLVLGRHLKYSSGYWPKTVT